MDGWFFYYSKNEKKKILEERLKKREESKNLPHDEDEGAEGNAENQSPERSKMKIPKK